MTMIYQPHDLLRIDRSLLGQSVVALDAATSSAIAECLGECAFVVVRRGQFCRDRIPVGIRGGLRNQRYAAWLEPEAVAESITPMSLLNFDQTRPSAVFRALQELRERWRHLDASWGPTGSAGFELATGTKAVSAGSDLDILVRCSTPFGRRDAEVMFSASLDLDCRVDIQIETPLGGFALVEFVKNTSRIVLRTATGPQLVSDPWQVQRLETVFA